MYKPESSLMPPELKLVFRLAILCQTAIRSGRICCHAAGLTA